MHGAPNASAPPAGRAGFIRPIRTDETQKGLRINTQAIILDWQHTFQTISCYPNLTYLNGCSFQAIIHCSS
jgi:hypothetical protein